MTLLHSLRLAPLNPAHFQRLILLNLVKEQGQDHIRFTALFGHHTNPGTVMKAIRQDRFHTAFKQPFLGKVIRQETQKLAGQDQKGNPLTISRSGIATHLLM